MRADVAKRDQQNDTPPPRESKLTATNIGIGGAAIATAWGVAGYVTKIPEFGQAGLSGTVGAVGIWAMVVAKYEERKKRKKENEDD